MERNNNSINIEEDKVDMFEIPDTKTLVKDKPLVKTLVKRISYYLDNSPLNHYPLPACLCHPYDQKT